ncbi:SLAM family member 8 isoform X3 [Notechis scutatus]|uniref:SLAM family member 8 isoform X3 n=1 Tax=Notechis scutatus TaxID=8663 RepID=A0A6J1W0V5_9SAUR|nr:SLAM family member 8 isoform X3 [Notechis scutatus]
MGWVPLTAWIIATSGLCMSRAYTPTQVLGVAGSSALFKAAPPPNFHSREFFWSSLQPSEELVATSLKGSPEIQYRSRFYGRTRLHDNFTLEIDPVDLEDAGKFSVLLVDTTGHMQKQTFELKVYDTISNPLIQVFTEEKDLNGSSETCLVFLTCHAASRTNVTYEWAGLAGKTGPRPKHWLMEGGQVLRTKLDPKEALQGRKCSTEFPETNRSSFSRRKTWIFLGLFWLKRWKVFCGGKNSLLPLRELKIVLRVSILQLPEFPRQHSYH